MNVNRDPEAIMAAWLDDGPAELPMDTRQAIAVGIRTVPRRRPGISWPAVKKPRLAPALAGAAAVVVVAALALNYFANQQGLGGPVASPSPTSEPTPSPLQSPRPGEATFTSAIHGISIDLPAGWQTRPATEPWAGGPLNFDSPAADVIFDPALGDRLYMVLASQPYGGLSEDAWRGVQIDWLCGANGGAAMGFNEVWSAGFPSFSISCGSTASAHLIFADTRGYLIRLVVSSGEPGLADTYDWDWHKPVLRTVDLRPEEALPSVPSPSPTAEPATAGGMWPQSNLEEVEAAQELADAGDPDYSWQVDQRLISTSQESDPLVSDPELWRYLTSPGAEIVERFLREILGWEEFLFSLNASAPVNQYGLVGLVYLRCAPGETNPLYPSAPGESAPSGERCAPTIDELSYEAVRLDLSQPDLEGANGIWVVSRWSTTQFAQADPSLTEGYATARLERFLRARIEGEGAEGYVEVFDLFGGSEDVPLLYATSSGAPYERFEIERVSGPHWPYGGMSFTVRLFAEAGETVVEQQISLVSTGGPQTLRYDVSGTSTTENGQPVR